MCSAKARLTLSPDELTALLTQTKCVTLVRQVLAYIVKDATSLHNAADIFNFTLESLQDPESGFQTLKGLFNFRLPRASQIRQFGGK